jgi:hypothetical protein
MSANEVERAQILLQVTRFYLLCWLRTLSDESGFALTLSCYWRV